MRRLPDLVRTNLRVAIERWGNLSSSALKTLQEIVRVHRFSLAMGDLLYLSGGWYVTNRGLIALAARHHCAGIQVDAIDESSDPSANCWVFKATVYRSRTCRGFVGYGDANPSNVSDLVRGAEMRVAETRAVNRALRKAYGIGICSVEELGARMDSPPPAAPLKKAADAPGPVNGNGHPLRNRLCLLVRQHRLDPALVKAYAADYCEVAELRQATREQVADFIQHLAQYAVHDREGLLCQLNSYAPKPVTPAAAPADNKDIDQQKDAGAA